jgi:hypothetical protein
MKSQESLTKLKLKPSAYFDHANIVRSEFFSLHAGGKYSIRVWSHQRNKVVSSKQKTIHLLFLFLKMANIYSQ